MTSLLDNVNSLISKGVGDLSRLEHIKQTIENNKELYSSDKNYVDNLIKNHLLPKDQTSENSKVQSSKNTENRVKMQKTFCGKCGAELESNNDFCTKCGSSTLSNVSKKEDYESNLKADTPKKKGRSKKKKLGIGFGITIFIFFVIAMAVPSSPNSPSNSFESNYYEIGETIKLKGIHIQVLRTTTSGTDFWNTPAGTFFHVYVKIENVGKTTDTFTPLQFVLVDGEGREFNHLYFFTNSEDAIWASEEIQPNLPITQFVTFDVPYASDLKYELKVINAGFVCLRNC